MLRAHIRCKWPINTPLHYFTPPPLPVPPPVADWGVLQRSVHEAGQHPGWQGVPARWVPQAPLPAVRRADHHRPPHHHQGPSRRALQVRSRHQWKLLHRLLPSRPGDHWRLHAEQAQWLWVRHSLWDWEALDYCPWWVVFPPTPTPVFSSNLKSVRR